MQKKRKRGLLCIPHFGECPCPHSHASEPFFLPLNALLVLQPLFCTQPYFFRYFPKYFDTSSFRKVREPYFLISFQNAGNRLFPLRGRSAMSSCQTRNGSTAGCGTRNGKGGENVRTGWPMGADVATDRLPTGGRDATIVQRKTAYFHTCMPLQSSPIFNLLLL